MLEVEVKIEIVWSKDGIARTPQFHSSVCNQRVVPIKSHPDPQQGVQKTTFSDIHMAIEFERKGSQYKMF